MRSGGREVKLETRSTPAPPTNITAPPPTMSAREQLKLEFYKTYDVMTGVRIAATLGGFFSLMVFFVVYKSRCGRGKSISSGDVAAAAAELDAVSELPFDGFYSLTAPRRSLGNMSAPAAVRCSRAGSYASESLPSCSIPGSGVLWGDAIRNPSAHQPVIRGSSFLVVPGVRLSSTGSSSDSSYYLEHHGSVELSLPPAPRPKRCWRRSTIAQEVLSNEDYPIDINVIQPTPDVSPCGSERQLYRQQRTRSGSSQWSTCGGKLAAPLASIGSASLTDYPEADARSIGSDSVFYNDELSSESSEEAATCESSDTESASSDEVCATHKLQSPPSRFLQVPTATAGPLAGRWKKRPSSPIPPVVAISLPLRQTGGSEQPEANSTRDSAETLF